MSIDLLIIFCCLNSAMAGKNPFYHRFVSLGDINMAERDRDNNIR